MKCLLMCFWQAAVISWLRRETVTFSEFKCLNLANKSLLAKINRPSCFVSQAASDPNPSWKCFCPGPLKQCKITCAVNTPTILFFITVKGRRRR